MPFQGPGFEGVLHDNLSNQKRQGSGFTPLIHKSYPAANLFRDDAVGLNFEHIFNGAQAQHAISMFTPRKDPCHVRDLGEDRFELHWPHAGSSWGMDARMIYDLSAPQYVDLAFECVPERDLYPQGFAAMMWASYMHRALDRKIYFWGRHGGRLGWVAFGEMHDAQPEVGTVRCDEVPPLPYEPGAQTLNLLEHSEKTFVTPFYYGLLGGDHDLDTRDDCLLFLVLFDQWESIRFAMWNFFRNERGEPDTHSPAWDWQYVIRDPVPGQRYGYRARVLVAPYRGVEQIWEAYQQWESDLGKDLPPAPSHRIPNPHHASCTQEAAAEGSEVD